MAFLEQERWREKKMTSKHTPEKVPVCLAMVTVDRKQRYVMQSVASIMYHLQRSNSANDVFFFLTSADAALESHPDAEYLHATTGVPYLRVPSKGFCAADRKLVNFYGRKAEVFAFAIDTCLGRLRDDGWVVLLEDDVVAAPGIGDKLHSLLLYQSNAFERVSLVKLFEPDEFSGWSFDNVGLLLGLALLGAVFMCAVFRIRCISGLLLCCALNALWLRATPLQVWSMLFRGSSAPTLQSGGIMHATQAIAIPIARNMSSTLRDVLCSYTANPAAEVNQDLIMLSWAGAAGAVLHATPSVFQHIGFSTSVRGPHQGWRLVDLTFGEEQMPFDRPER